MVPSSASIVQTTLLIECGNSRCKWARLGEDGLHYLGAMSYEQGSDEDLVRAWREVEGLEQLVFASVTISPKFSRALDAFRSQWQGPVYQLTTHQHVAGLQLAYEQPETLGVDRWLALLAAIGHGDGPMCIVDCGTAMTIDVVSKDGRHLGGQIIPGLEMMRRSLHYGTGLLPLSDAPRTESLLGRDTETCIAMGTLTALAGAIRLVMEELGLDGHIHGIISGGNASEVLPLLHGHWDLRPHLVLEGMAVVVEHKMMGDAL